MTATPRYEVVMYYRHTGQSHSAGHPFATNAAAEAFRAKCEAKNAGRLDEIGFSIRKYFVTLR